MPEQLADRPRGVEAWPVPVGRSQGGQQGVECPTGGFQLDTQGLMHGTLGLGWYALRAIVHRMSLSSRHAGAAHLDRSLRL
jgi:hypothetical protein